MRKYPNFKFKFNNPIVDKGKTKELEDFFANDSEKDFGFYKVKLIITEDGLLEDIELGTSHDNFYDDAIFADKLASCLVSGSVLLVFFGEAVFSWGYEITPNKVEELISILIPVKELREMVKLVEKNKS